MSWVPMQSFSMIVDAERANLPIVLSHIEGAPIIEKGKKYRFRTDILEFGGVVVGINYGAESALRVHYRNAFGDSLELDISPNAIIWAKPI